MENQPAREQPKMDTLRNGRNKRGYEFPEPKPRLWGHIRWRLPVWRTRQGKRSATFGKVFLNANIGRVLYVLLYHGFVSTRETECVLGQSRFTHEGGVATGGFE